MVRSACIPEVSVRTTDRTRSRSFPANPSNRAKASGRDTSKALSAGVDDSSDSCASGDLGWTSDASTDNDGDGCQDSSSEDDDDDNDTYADGVDAFPLDSTEWADNDADGTGDNADTDDDNDGYDDANDSFPFDEDAWDDTDGDGLADDFPNLQETPTSTVCDSGGYVTSGYFTCDVTVAAGESFTLTFGPYYGAPYGPGTLATPSGGSISLWTDIYSYAYGTYGPYSDAGTYTLVYDPSYSNMNMYSVTGTLTGVTTTPATASAGGRTSSR